MKATALVFAAGRGERLRPLTDEIAKPALPLLDVPVAAYALERLRRAGLVPLVNLSHLAGAARRALEPHVPRALWLREPPEPYGTAGTLREAHVRGLLASEVVAWNGDVLAEVDPGELLAAHRREGAPVTAVVEEVEERADFLVEGRRAVGFVDRRHRSSARGARFAGISVLSSDVVALIPRDAPAGLGEWVLAPLAERGEIALVPARDVLDVGTVRSFLDASLALLHRAPGAGPRPPGRIVEGGRAYLGPEARVEADSLGPGAVVLRGAEVDRGATVERAVVWPGDHVPPGTTAKDCIWFRGTALTP